MAAGTELEGEAQRDPSDLAPVVQVGVTIDGQQFELAEDPAEGSVFLLGNVPPTATQMSIGPSSYELKHSEDGSSVEVVGVGLAEMEAPLKRHFLDPASHPIKFSSNG